VLKDKSKVERRLIHQVGVRGDDMEVADGVTAGEIIAVKGAGFLKDGDTVKVANEAEAPQAEAPPAKQAAP
jgi:HlyD family secretion protein